MNWQSVNSSNMDSVAYDADSSTLYVRFNSGATYSYSGVPQSEYNGLMSASSHGTYLNAHIKGSYPYQKL
ncbi:KTSC domain-containing protein [Paenibacillus peoriae]|uniref:KTSC domain-containing protein n=1 Tax=Paenibacillus peoriae TaxID=59893 RepID=UPI00096E3431|nr:KTSC domain-containing protein [Paenibacillus peoriae]OMF40338.1 KTSC domain-containing protein [Paenibacillus peoriae]